ncbi:MAG: hypothetical protein U5R31_03555 [Acidimicrobiia bacterium]|nr:hypothetical protein [Acidimicrobiia bacterium]
MSPKRAAGTPKMASEVATRRSQAMASCVPAPSAAPSTAASAGRGVLRSGDQHLVEAGGEGGVLDGPEIGAGAEVTTRAAEDEDPTGQLGHGVGELLERLVVDGVATVGPVDGDDGDLAALLGSDHGRGR